MPPDPATWDAFCRVLQARCLIYGGFASDEGIDLLVGGAITRLVEASPAMASIAQYSDFTRTG